MIPDEVLFRGQALGYLPDEYMEAAAQTIKTQESPDKTAEKVDQLFSKFSPGVTLAMVKILMATGGNDVKQALFKSKVVTKWLDENREMMLREINNR